MDAATGAIGGAPNGSPKRVRGVPKLVGGAASFGGAPYGATKRVRGVPKWVGRTHAGGPTGAFLRWSSLWGHETCEWCAEMGSGTHAIGDTGTFGGAPYPKAPAVAVSTCVRATHVGAPIERFVASNGRDPFHEKRSHRKG